LSELAFLDQLRIRKEVLYINKIYYHPFRRKPYLGHDLQEELSGFKSFKSKRYRIIYKVEEGGSSVDIYLVGHRRDVYEQFRVLLRRLK
jgi:mRNA-degrading endonuclease RelE of RelBE toxin-antitoxin system